MTTSREPVSVLDLRALIQQYLSSGDVDLATIGDARSNNVVVTFKDDARNPYGSHLDHQVIEFTGNASVLPDLFARGGIVRHSYNLGEVAAPANNILDGNWSKEPNKGAWLLDFPGRVFLDVQGLNEGKTYQLTLEASGLVNESHPMQRVTIEVNGIGIGTLELTRDTELVSVKIPGNALKKGTSSLDVAFVPLDAKSPKELGLWDTSMPVSMYIRSFQLDEYKSDRGYVLGTLLSPANEVLFGDFSKERGKGAWLKEDKGQIRLKLAEQMIDTDLELVINGTPLLSDSHTRQRIRVEVGGQDLGVLEFTSAFSDGSVRIPKELVRQELTISLLPLDAVSPKYLGRWDTEESISLYIYSVLLNQFAD